MVGFVLICSYVDQFFSFVLARSCHVCRFCYNVGSYFVFAIRTTNFWAIYRCGKNEERERGKERIYVNLLFIISLFILLGWAQTNGIWKMTVGYLTHLFSSCWFFDNTSLFFTTYSLSLFHSLSLLGSSIYPSQSPSIFLAFFRLQWSLCTFSPVRFLCRCVYLWHLKHVS